MPLLTELIDKQDNVEVIRDQIAAIILDEQAGQQALATAAGKDPRLWALRVFTERSNPWAAFQAGEDEALDVTPIVNVAFENTNFDKAASNTVQRQKGAFTFNIDCYGYGVARDATGDGHIAGDEQAAIDSARAVRLVRNILMSERYTYLGMRKTVWSRWTANVTAFQPEFDGRTIQQVLATRIAFEVEASEFGPQIQGNPLDIISVTVKRAETGEIYFVTEFD